MLILNMHSKSTSTIEKRGNSKSIPRSRIKFISSKSISMSIFKEVSVQNQFQYWQILIHQNSNCQHQELIEIMKRWSSIQRVLCSNDDVTHLMGKMLLSLSLTLVSNFDFDSECLVVNINIQNQHWQSSFSKSKLNIQDWALGWQYQYSNSRFKGCTSRLVLNFNICKFAWQYSIPKSKSLRHQIQHQFQEYCQYQHQNQPISIILPTSEFR